MNNLVKKIFTSSIVSTTVFAADLTVEVTGLLNLNEKLAVALQSDKEDYDNRANMFKRARLDIKKKNLTYTLKNIPNGVYAIILQHDEN